MYKWFSLSRIKLELRLRFEDDVILVQLRVHRVNLALAKGIVERVVDRGRGNPQTGSCCAIYNQRYGKAAQLLIGSHIFKLRQSFNLATKRPDHRFSSS